MAKLVYTYSAPVTAGLQATSNTINAFVDNSEPDSITGLTASRGTAFAIGGGGIVLDLRGDSATTDITLNYTRHSGASSEAVEATVTVDASYYAQGFQDGEYYLPEVDASTDDLIFEPGQTTRIVCCKPDGWSSAAIIANEPSLGGNPPANWSAWMRDNPANGYGGRYYGEGDDLALDEEHGIGLWFRFISDTRFASPWLLFKRGETYTADYSLVDLQERQAQGALHPALIGVYGSGALPVFTASGSPRMRKCTAFARVGGVMSADISITDWGSYNLYDNFVVDFVGTSKSGNSAMTADGLTTAILYHCTHRRIKARGTYNKTVPVGDTWTGTEFIGSCDHPGHSMNILRDKVFISQSGASTAYRADWSTLAPEPPDTLSHGIYQSNGALGHFYRDVVIGYPSLAIMQHRSGGITNRLIGFGGNTGCNVSIGAFDRNDVLGLPNINGGRYTLYSNTWLTRAGFKGKWGAGTVGAGARGFDVGTPDVCFANSGTFNSGTARIYASATDIGPGTTNVPSGANWGPLDVLDLAEDDVGIPSIHPKSNFMVSGWNRAEHPDGIYTYDDTYTALPAGALSQTERDARTIEARAAERMGGTPTAWEYADWLFENDDAPWDEAAYLNAWFREALGIPVPTPVADETLTFTPSTTFHTPGFHSCLELDWDKGYLPGDTTGNNVVIRSNITWNHHPKNALNGVTLGAGVAMRLFSSTFRPTSLTLEGAVSFDLMTGAKVELPDLDGTFNADICDSRMVVAGDVVNDGNVEVHYEGQFIIKEGGSYTNHGTLTLHGTSRPGFDGSAGGTASLVLASDGTLEVSPGVRAEVDGCPFTDIFIDGPGSSEPKTNDFYWPKRGTNVTGGTSGSTALVRERIRKDGVTAYLGLERPTGAFNDNEAVMTGVTEIGPFLSADSYQLGDVKGAWVWTWPTFGEVRSGINGVDSNFVPVATNVVGSITINGRFHINATNMAVSATPYTILIADAMSGVFTEVTAEGNSDKDLTVAIDTAATPKTVKVTVASGSGAISGGTA